MSGSYHRNSKDDDIHSDSTTQSRNIAITDLSNANLISFRDGPQISSRRLYRIHRQLLIFEWLILVVHLLLFGAKLYIVWDYFELYDS